MPDLKQPLANDSASRQVDANSNPSQLKANVLPAGSLSLILPFILVPNAYSVYGVLALDWSVADLYFWFWCEFVLSGITTFVLLLFWPEEPGIPKGMAGIAKWGFLFSFIYILLFASLFAGIAYKGEWKSWDRFPVFFADKRLGLIATILTYIILLVLTLMKRKNGTAEATRLGQQFNRRAIVIVGVYILFLIHGWSREWFTGSRGLPMSAEYLKFMAVTLLLLKAVAEVGLFDRLLKRNRRVPVTGFHAGGI